MGEVVRRRTRACELFKPLTLRKSHPRMGTDLWSTTVVRAPSSHRGLLQISELIGPT